MRIKAPIALVMTDLNLYLPTFAIKMPIRIDYESSTYLIN